MNNSDKEDLSAICNYLVKQQIPAQSLLKYADEKIVIDKKKEELYNSRKIDIAELHNFKTTSATLKFALIKKGVYLPKHFKKQTSV